MLVKVILALIFFSTVTVASRQEIVLYTESDYTGASETFYDTELDLPENSEIGRIAKSICVVKGVWVVSGIINGEAHFTGWQSGNIGRFCSTWNVKNQTGIYLSIRRVAGGNLDTPSISLYSQINFKGEEIHIADSNEFQMENSSIDIQSVAFTGRRHWNIFSRRDFDGVTNCMLAQDFLGYPMDVSFYAREDVHFGSLRMDCPDTLPLFKYSPRNSRQLDVQVQPSEGVENFQQDLTVRMGQHKLAFAQVALSKFHKPLFQLQ